MEPFYPRNRQQWRDYLERHFENTKEIWIVFPTKESGETGITYNEAVEEALCFGWIDGRAGTLDETHHLRRFTPRRKGSPYSRPNIERLIRLEKHGMVHPKVRESILPIIQAPFIVPEDIIQALKQDEKAWENYQKLSDPYKRIRIAYIDAARKRPEEFQKRLSHFMQITRLGKWIKGYGGIEEYYK